MQRSRANAWLRAIHNKSAETPRRRLENLIDEAGEAGEGMNLLPHPLGGGEPTVERANSKEWAESMLRWDGSAVRPTGVGGDADGNVIADFDDPEMAASGLAASGRGLSVNQVAIMKTRSLRVRKSAEKKAKKPAVSWDDLFTPASDLRNITDSLFTNWINLMLLALPVAIASHYLAWPAIIVFIFNVIAIVPLALLLGEITEDLAIRFGDVWGGLINATFGNVVEMILSIVLLMKGLTTVVSTSLIGSILSNLLLVIGCCFFVGGLNFKHQTFSSGASKANVSLLFMSCIAVLLPSMISYSDNGHKDPKKEDEQVKQISHIIALVLTGMYLCYLYFQLVTHNHVFISVSDNRVTNREEEEEEEEEEPQYSMLGALMLMTMTTVVVAFCSEYLSGSIEEVSKKSGLSLSFIGMIILPIAGNACEHITAVLVAAKDKMDLAIAVGVGSSIQIAIFVYPFVVLVGWAMGVDFTLKLNLFDVMVVCVSVVLAAFVTMDGNSHWFTGLMLIATYILVAITYFYG